MSEYTVGIVGTGDEHGGVEGGSFAMGYRHADAYTAIDSCELVACADIVPENANRFAEYYGVAVDNAFEDHHDMLEAVDLDIVSVTTPIPSHSEIVVDCARAGVEAVHCEKPMSNTWGGIRRVIDACENHDVQLTFNHQLRFCGPVQAAKRRIEEGEIGSVHRVEAARQDLFETGIHQLDVCSYLSGDVRGEWVLGAIDYRNEETKYGVHVEDQAMGTWKYTNGVHGLVSTGEGMDTIGTHNRIIGTEGHIEIDLWEEETVKIWRDGESPATLEVELGEPIHDTISHLVETLGTETEPHVSARRIRIGTELALGIYESVRRRGRVDLPLEIDDNPLHAMVESGDVTPI